MLIILSINDFWHYIQIKTKVQLKAEYNSTSGY